MFTCGNSCNVSVVFLIAAPSFRASSLQDEQSRSQSALLCLITGVTICSAASAAAPPLETPDTATVAAAAPAAANAARATWSIGRTSRSDGSGGRRTAWPSHLRSAVRAELVLEEVERCREAAMPSGKDLHGQTMPSDEELRRCAGVCSRASYTLQCFFFVFRQNGGKMIGFGRESAARPRKVGAGGSSRRPASQNNALNEV